MKPNIKYKDGYQYQLVEPYAVGVSIPSRPIQTKYLRLEGGLLTILDGYAWDGPSGPSIHSLNFMRGSLVHDALYQLIRQGQLGSCWRDEADRELRRICKEDGMSSIRAWWVYKAVRLAGWWAATPAAIKKVFTAPKEG